MPHAMAEAFMKHGYKVVSDGTDNHSMLIDLRTKTERYHRETGGKHPGGGRYYCQ